MKDFYRSRPEPDHSIYLEWCDDCRNHINLWSYWQGSLDARIMVVGQDWGCPKGAAVMDNIRAINDGSEKEYHVDPDSLTDKNLCTLLASIGFPAETWNPELFFTNFALGYRNKGLTGGFKGSWLRECEPFFKRLVEIVEPEIIICRGALRILRNSEPGKGQRKRRSGPSARRLEKDKAGAGEMKEERQIRS